MFTPIINSPEVAILGVSKSAMKPVWNGKEFAPRLMLPLSFSYDHRVIDGAMGARIAKFLADTLAKPRISSGRCREQDRSDRSGPRQFRRGRHRRCARQGRRQDRGGNTAGHARNRQGHDGRAVHRGGHRHRSAGAEGRQDRQGWIDRAHRRELRPPRRLRSACWRRAGCCRSCREGRSGTSSRGGARAARSASSRAEAVEAAQARRAARSRDPVVSAGRRSRRLHRRVPRRRSRPQGHAGRTLAHAGRRLPQRRLHSLQGAAACRQGHRRSRRDEPSRHRVRCAQDRSGQAARLEEQRRQETRGWPVGAGQAAQGRGGHGRGQVRQPACDGSDRQRWQVAEDPLRAMHHRRRLRGHQTTVHPERSACHRFDGRAGAGRRAEAPAGHRRRHHRPGNGHGVCRARREALGGRAHRPAHAGRGSGPRAAAREAPQGALRADPAQHQGHRLHGDAGRPRGGVRRRQWQAHGCIRSRAGGRGPQRQWQAHQSREPRTST